MIHITGSLAIDESELHEEFVRSAGPGGQNVNKVATAVQLRFNIQTSPSLPEEVRLRLRRLAGARVTADGVLIITAQRFRTQAQNREDALTQLIALLRAAAVRPKPRHATRPTLASKQRRLESKRRQGQRKGLRRTPPDRNE
jgi:ribosome-associated protein